MLYPLIKLFESKSCDLTIQVNFFCFCWWFIVKINHKNHCWQLELKEGLILVATQAYAINRSVKILIIFLVSESCLHTRRFQLKKYILSLLSIILLSFNLLKKYSFSKKSKFLNFYFCGVFYYNRYLNLVFSCNVHLLCITDLSGT